MVERLKPLEWNLLQLHLSIDIHIGLVFKNTSCPLLQTYTRIFKCTKDNVEYCRMSIGPILHSAQFHVAWESNTQHSSSTTGGLLCQGLSEGGSMAHQNPSRLPPSNQQLSTPPHLLLHPWPRNASSLLLCLLQDLA